MGLNKGYVVMIDSFIGLALAGFVLLFFLHQGAGNANTSWHDVRLLSRDFLDYSFNTGVLAAAVANDTDTVRTALLEFPPKYCSVLSVYSSDGALVSSVSRPDCSLISSQKMVLYRPFVYGGSTYVASMTSWYN